MTIKDRLKSQANAIIEKAQGREFSEAEREFLHALNNLIQIQIVKQYKARIS